MTYRAADVGEQLIHPLLERLHDRVPNFPATTATRFSSDSVSSRLALSFAARRDSLFSL
jgi:hypothetical protein